MQGCQQQIHGITEVRKRKTEKSNDYVRHRMKGQAVVERLKNSTFQTVLFLRPYTLGLPELMQLNFIYIYCNFKGSYWTCRRSGVFGHKTDKTIAA